MKRPAQLRPEDSHTLTGMESADCDRAQARAEQTGADLTLEMRRPKADISQTSGLIERDAPLFFGTGSNPTLF